MNIQAEKIEIAKMVLDTDNPEMLTAIKQILNSNNDKDFWNKISEEEKAGIRKGLDDLNKGNLEDYEEFIKDFR